MYPCPSYTIRVYEDGSAKFSGKDNVAKIGDYEGTVGPDFNRILWKSISDAQLKEKKNKYGTGKRRHPRDRY